MRKPPPTFQLDLFNPGHENCRHRHYLLSCRGYERLLARARGRCEICGRFGVQNLRRKLFIDHDYLLGDWAVRGLLCSLCNLEMETGGIADRQARAKFLANPFYAELLAECQVPLHMDEPPLESKVADCKGQSWTRIAEGWKPGRFGRALCVEKWPYLYRRSGPIILSHTLVLPADK